jgi:hypothetical protein
VGVGPAADVDRYLAGASVETVDDIETGPFRLETSVRTGTAQLAPPVDQDFWVARSSGATSAATSWHLQGGRYRVVVMNADGTPGIHADGKFGLHVPWLTPVAFTALGGGAAVLLAGLTIVVLGLRNEPEPTPVDSPSPYVTVGL